MTLLTRCLLLFVVIVVVIQLQTAIRIVPTISEAEGEVMIQLKMQFHLPSSASSSSASASTTITERSGTSSNQQPPQQLKGLLRDGRNDDKTKAEIDDNFEQAVQEKLKQHGHNNSKEAKPIVLMCSKENSILNSKHFLRMLFPKFGYKEVLYDIATSEELPSWDYPATFIYQREGGLPKSCSENSWYVEAKNRRRESPLLPYIPHRNRWHHGIHWPENTTVSGLRFLKNRPMIIELLGEVFFRNIYTSKTDIDLAIYRSKANPRPGSLTYHDIQGISHHYRREFKNQSMYENSSVALKLWTSSNINENPYRYDAKTNNKGFCTMLIGNVFKVMYDMDALIRSSMFRLLGELYKPCVKPVVECPPGDLMSYECMSGYKFVITMENTMLDGYVSEKVFMGKLAGSVPIYAGASDVADFLNPKSFINCPISPNLITELRQYLINPPNDKYNDLTKRIFTMFDSTNPTVVTQVNTTQLLDWAVNYLRPHLQPCIQRIIELDNNDALYEKMRNEPLVTNPDILQGYATKGLGSAYKLLTSGTGKGGDEISNI